jgi:hypothetical protein
MSIRSVAILDAAPRRNRPPAVKPPLAWTISVARTRGVVARRLRVAGIAPGGGNPPDREKLIFSPAPALVAAMQTTKSKAGAARRGAR